MKKLLRGSALLVLLVGGVLLQARFRDSRSDSASALPVGEHNEQVLREEPSPIQSPHREITPPRRSAADRTAQTNRQPGLEATPALDLRLFEKERLYTIFEVAPPPGVSVRYRYDSHAALRVRQGNLLEITWTPKPQQGTRADLGRVHSNYFIQDEFVPSNPKVAFASNAPYFLVEHYQRDRGGHSVWIYYSLFGESYDWDTPPSRRDQLGVVETRTHVDRTGGRVALSFTIVLHEAAPGGTRIGVARLGELGETREEEGVELGRLPVGDEQRLHFFLEFFLRRLSSKGPDQH